MSPDRVSNPGHLTALQLVPGKNIRVPGKNISVLMGIWCGRKNLSEGN